jgi:hypothetical protein
VTLHQEEVAALGALAEQERRDPRDQAAVLIRRGLEQRGLLPPADEAAPDHTKDTLITDQYGKQEGGG